MKNTKAWKRSIRSVCRSVKATEIYYSLPVACVVYFHSYLIERKRPAEMIFSHQTDYTRYWAACKPSNEQGKMHGKKNSNSWSHLFFFPLYTFRQKSFRSVNIVECYINFKLDTNIQNRSPPRMYEFLLGKIQQEKKRRKNYERNIRKMRFLSSFYSLETFQKLQCLPKDYAITQPKFGKSFKPLNYMRKSVVHSLFGVSPLALMLRR